MDVSFWCPEPIRQLAATLGTDKPAEAPDGDLRG